MTRSVCVSPAVSESSASPDAIGCEDTAPASGQPAQPPVFRSSVPAAAALTSAVQFTASPVSATVTGAVGDGAGTGAGDGDGWVAADLESGGIRTRKTSSRP